ncbi:hypothetical protein EUGRSUZ_H02447 [Eucalyptus grandis]|uniref:Bromodomain associated domain-containing protein n=2 Tax=Eucalyptus grandis TaxID=71139 RepID=A0A059B0B8_EUCGR|nr:hypothetical protein EUGRSUZ_H02447 [Eucalyptus grandis]
MALLGDDGRGYELARKLESLGVWRTWLGDSGYLSFAPFLSTPSSWDAFMRADGSTPRAQLHLQLRARALLFDKASVSLFLRTPSAAAAPAAAAAGVKAPSSSSTSVAVARLNHPYLQLHGDDLYFTLDGASQDGAPQREGLNASSSMSSKGMQSQSKATFGVGPRYSDAEVDASSQRSRKEDLPETWYDQFIEKHRASKPYRISNGGLGSSKRTPEDMFSYLKLLEKHKRKRAVYKDGQAGILNPTQHTPIGINAGPVQDVGSDDDTSFLPEVMFMSNCVPDSALPVSYRLEDKSKVEFRGVLDSLPQVVTRSPVMIERLGIRPEYLSSEQGGSLYRGKNGLEGSGKHLGEEQALLVSQKVIARMLTGLGFEGATEVPIEVFAQLLGSHICKLGRNLKVLADSYRKQYSAIELLKMFLQVSGFSNLGTLAELVKDGPKNLSQQSQLQVPEMQPLLHSQQQTPLRLTQQMPRQMIPQMQQLMTSHNLQHLENMRRRQASGPRPVMDFDKSRPMVQVKLENPSDLPIDGNAFNNAVNMRHPQMQQFRQQQMAALSNLHPQHNNQFRPMSAFQISQMQAQNIGMVRAQPVKVEGFQELMGGDSTMKHDSDENKLASPSSK